MKKPLLLASLFAISLSLASPALAGDPNTGAPSPESSALSLDLKCFREQSLRSLRAHYPGAEFTEEKIIFQDGVGSADMPPLYDLARVVFSAKLGGEGFRDSRIRVAHYVSLQGFEKPMLVIAPDAENASYYLPNSIIALFRAEILEAEKAAIQARLAADFPDYHQTYLETVNAIALEGGNPAKLPGLERALTDSGLFSAVDLSGEVYRMPVEIGAPLALGAGLVSETIDVDSLRTISREYRENGTEFTTESQLPAIACDNPRR